MPQISHSTEEKIENKKKEIACIKISLSAIYWQSWLETNYPKNKNKN